MYGSHGESGALTPSRLFEGQVFDGRFQILSILGEGGVGVVYQAQHLEMGNIVAIKTLMPSMISDDTTYLRFKQEAQAATTLTHPNIITIHDFGRSAEGIPFIVMEYLGSKTLDDLLKNGQTLDLDTFLRIFTQVCDGLQHAHKKGIVHRDMKPSNVMLLDDDDAQNLVKIVDFGLAKLTTASQSQLNLTKTGVVLGTPLYMSPEQCRGSRLDQRSDIYSVGCMMYAALCGKVPHHGETALNTLMKHLIEPPAPFVLSAPELVLPPTLETVILKALQKEPNERQQSMSELKTDITNAIYFRHPQSAIPTTEPDKFKQRPASIAAPVDRSSTAPVVPAPGSSTAPVVPAPGSSPTHDQLTPIVAAVPAAPPGTRPMPARPVPKPVRQGSLAGDTTGEPNIGKAVLVTIAITAAVAVPAVWFFSSWQRQPAKPTPVAAAAVRAPAATAATVTAQIATAASGTAGTRAAASEPPKIVAPPAVKPLVEIPAPQKNATKPHAKAVAPTGINPPKPTETMSPAQAQHQANVKAAAQYAAEANKLYNQGNAKQADSSYRKCLKAQIDAFGSLDAQVFVTDARLVDCSLQEKDIRLAQWFMKQALPIYDHDKARAQAVARQTEEQSAKIWYPLAFAASTMVPENDYYLHWTGALAAQAFENCNQQTDPELFKKIKLLLVTALDRLDPDGAFDFRQKYHMAQPKQGKPPARKPGPKKQGFKVPRGWSDRRW